MPLAPSSLGVDWISTPNGLPTGFYRHGPDIGDNGSTSFVTNVTTVATPTFTPLTPTSCWLWLDANDSTKVSTTGSNVTTWTDKSSNAASFNVSGTNPTYTNTQNSKSVVSFGGAGCLKGPNTFSVGTNNFALYIVFKFSSTTTGIQGIFNKSFWGGQPGRFYCYKDTVMNMSLQRDTVSPNLSPYSDTIPNDTYRVLSFICNRSLGVDTVYENGTSKSNINYTPDITTNLPNNNVALVGAYNDGTGSGVTTNPSTYLNGSIAEIISYNPSDMTNYSVTQQKIEGYLAWKWGLNATLPNNHPYFAKSP